MTTVSKIDWFEARMHYVTSSEKLTLQEIADIFNVSKSAVHKHYSEEDWEKLRDDYFRRAVAKIENMMLEDRAAKYKEAADVLDRLVIDGLKELQVKVTSGDKKLSIPDIAKLNDLRKKLLTETEGRLINDKITTSKKIYKRLEECTISELDKISRGEAVLVSTDKSESKAENIKVIRSNFVKKTGEVDSG